MARIRWSFALVVALLLPLAVAGTSWAKGDPATREQVLAVLQAPEGGPDPDAEGVAKRRLVERGDRMRERFDAHLETLRFGNESDAAAAVFTLVLPDIGTCALAFDGFDPETLEAQYGVDVRREGETLEVRKGSCQDLNGDPVLPAVQDGDSARIEDAGMAILVEGVFLSRGGGRRSP
jgi:hypothetical protein